MLTLTTSPPHAGVEHQSLRLLRVFLTTSTRYGAEPQPFSNLPYDRVGCLWGGSFQEESHLEGGVREGGLGG